MSLAVALPFGVASAVVYGASIVVQHRVASESGREGGGESAKGLLSLIRHPTFLLAIAGDFIGFVLQIVALTAGAVVYVQPLVVLMLPVSLLVSFLLGGPRPRRADAVGSLGVVGGLAVFLMLIGAPQVERVPHPRLLAWTIVGVLVVGGLLALVGTGRNRILRGAVYGAAAGLYFGALAVMVDAASERASSGGMHALLATHRGIVPLIGILVLGGGGILLTQLSFQVGALSATLPANLAVDPVVGVVLGAILLREHIPLTPLHLVAYLACLAAVVAGTIELATSPTGAAEGGAPGANPKTAAGPGADHTAATPQPGTGTDG